MALLARRRTLSVCAIALLASALLGVAPSAIASSRKHPRVPRALTFHPRFQRVRGNALVASDRYVYISKGANQGVLIDTRTMRQRVVSAPGCRPSALGGPWIAFTCGVATNQTTPLYDIATGSFHPFIATGGYRECDNMTCLPIVAVGADWVALQAPPSDSHTLPQFEFQNIETGEILGDPTTSTTDIDLDSPQLTRSVCPPLTVPEVKNVYSSDWGSLTFDDGFVIAAGTGGAYLERCGSHLHEFLTFTMPNYVASPNAGCPHVDCPPAYNSRMIVWQSAAGRLRGIFLPDRQKFTIPVPPRVDPQQPGFANGDRYQLALTAARVYLVTPGGQIWSAPAPSEPRHRRHRHR